MTPETRKLDQIRRGPICVSFRDPIQVILAPIRFYSDNEGVQCWAAISDDIGVRVYFGETKEDAFGVFEETAIDAAQMVHDKDIPYAIRRTFDTLKHRMTLVVDEMAQDEQDVEDMYEVVKQFSKGV